MLMRFRLGRRRARSEQGIALVTALLVMMVCTIVMAAILQLASHSAQRSGLARDRTAALNAAEAGIQAELSAISDGSCPPSSPPSLPGAAVQLPNQTLPSAWYVIQASPVNTCSTASAAVTIVATGYVSSVTNPAATTTMVAHVNRTQGAPVSGGASNNVRPYNFPDALFTDGTLRATGGALNLYGSGGSVPSVTANGAITIGSSSNTGSLLGGAINGQSSVNVWASQIGGPVTGTSVSLTGPASGLTVQGGTSPSPSLTNVTLNGAQNLSLLPPRPLGVFDNSNPGEIGTSLGVGTTTAPVGSPTNTCPSSSTSGASNFYDVAATCGSGYAPTTYSPPTGGNGITVLVVQGAFTVTVPPTAVGGQLYVVDVGGGNSDVLTIAGTGSTLPVFAFSDSAVTLSGTLAGQVVAHQIDVTGASTTLTFAPPATPMPDVSFPVGYFSPKFSGPFIPFIPFISTVSYEYQCPGTNVC
jgi:Tfp pilus assembly protein PilX